jgi:SAM-dependent methyltransferase
MHIEALQNGALFFFTYAIRLGDITVVDIGAQDVNGSLRQFSPPKAKYIGVDFAEAKGVDIVLDDPYMLPFEENSIDVIVSSSCFEHSEMFWLLYLEILRVLKPDGLFYLNAPSACGFHRYPVDCYRFYPDSGNALAKWGKRNGYNPIALEHYTTGGDYICVTLKDGAFLDKHPHRMLQRMKEFACGGVYPEFDTFLFPSDLNGKNFTHYAPHLLMPGELE